MFRCASHLGVRDTRITRLQWNYSKRFCRAVQGTAESLLPTVISIRYQGNLAYAAPCVATFATASTPSIYGQVNIEALRSERVDSGIVGSLEVNLSLRTGNVEFVRLGINARVDRATASSFSLFLLNGDVGLVTGDRFTNDGLLGPVRRSL